MAVRIRCINKDAGNHSNPHEAISHYGWIDEATGKQDKSDRNSMVEWMLKNNGVAYVTDAWDRKVFCIVRESPNGTKFLQTISDNRVTNNLLELPECR